jgi:hypothetical protein
VGCSVLDIVGGKHIGSLVFGLFPSPFPLSRSGVGRGNMGETRVRKTRDKRLRIAAGESGQTNTGTKHDEWVDEAPLMQDIAGRRVGKKDKEGQRRQRRQRRGRTYGRRLPRCLCPSTAASLEKKEEETKPTRHERRNAQRSQKWKIQLTHTKCGRGSVSFRGGSGTGDRALAEQEGDEGRRVGATAGQVEGGQARGRLHAHVCPCARRRRGRR